MKNLLLIFSVLLSASLYGQLGPDGTGTVNGYYIGPGADLSGADLSGADLSGADLSGADLTDANLEGANLTVGQEITYDRRGRVRYRDRYVDLTNANFTGVSSGNIIGDPILSTDYQIQNGYIIGPNVNLTGADLTGVDLIGAYLSGADLSNANLTGAYLAQSNISNTNLSGANLSSANLRNLNLRGNNLINADLSNADLSIAYLEGANLEGANLESANFTGVSSGNIIGTPILSTDYQIQNGYIIGPNVNLTGANLTGLDLSETNLSNADLSGADLSFANLAGANLEGANTDGANLDSVIFYTTNEHLVTALNSALEALLLAEAERDARPTQASYDEVVAERDAKLTLDEVKDLRTGSIMIEVDNGQAILTMEIEESDDLGIWTNGGASTLQIPIDAEAGKKFFRFKMTE